MPDDTKTHSGLSELPASPSDEQGWRNAARATWTLQWSELSTRDALRCLPGMALPLIFGIASGNPGFGVLASSGALVAGYGSSQRLGGSCLPPMLLASIGISLSGFAGTLAGHSDFGFVVVASLWAFATGLLAALSTGAWWIALQCAVFAVIASHFPQGWVETIARTATIAAGGLLQTLLILTFQYFDRAPCETPGEEASRKSLLHRLRPALQTLRENLALNTPVGREALRLALAVGIAAAVSRWLALPNGYWMPMTVLLVLKADLYETVTRGLGRISGTVVGGGLATLLAATLRPGPVLLALLVVVFSGLCFSMLRVNYALFTLCVTAYVAFQLALIGLPEDTVVLTRILSTLLGGVVALLAHLVWHPIAENIPASPTLAGNALSREPCGGTRLELEVFGERPPGE